MRATRHYSSDRMPAARLPGGFRIQAGLSDPLVTACRPERAGHHCAHRASRLRSHRISPDQSRSIPFVSSRTSHHDDPPRRIDGADRTGHASPFAEQYRHLHEGCIRGLACSGQTLADDGRCMMSTIREGLAQYVAN